MRRGEKTAKGERELEKKKEMLRFARRRQSGECDRQIEKRRNEAYNEHNQKTSCDLIHSRLHLIIAASFCIKDKTIKTRQLRQDNKDNNGLIPSVSAESAH